VKLGIDFGTCYSSAALFIDGKLSPVREPSRPSEYCFPSSVCVTKKGEIVISQAAENKRLLNPQGYKNEFKRDLETGIPYALGEKSLFPEDLVAIMIQGLKKEAEKIVNSSLNSVVITIPATYLSSKKQLMETAAKKAGFTEVTLLAEPVAAAIYYAEKGSLGHQLNEGDIVLVYDLGGGTFDAALIQKKGHSYELLGQPEGDKQCGGIDFDRLIGQDLKRQLNGDPALDLLTNKRTDNDALRAKLNFQDWCRNFKHQLSVEEEYEDLSPVGSDSYSLSREQFESMIAEYIDKSCNLCQNLVNKAGIKWEKVNRILLVGGSCRIPYVKKRLEQQFKRQVVAIDDPELAICFGAAIYGVQQHSNQLSKVVTVDATGRGDYKTIQSAIDNSMSGTRIIVNPGTYQESIRIDREVEIFGQEAVLIGENKSHDSTITMVTQKATIKGLIIANKADSDNITVIITTGCLTLERCDIRSMKGCGISISGEESQGIINNCQIHGTENIGIYLSNKGSATLDKCDIYDNLNGIIVMNKSKLIAKNSSFYNNQKHGISFVGKTSGKIDKCESYGNERGIWIGEESNPIVSNSKFYNNEFGIIFTEKGLGRIDNCEIYENESGIYVSEESNPTIENSKIYSNESMGIYMEEENNATIENSKIYSNQSTGIAISNSWGNIIKCEIYLNKCAGIMAENSKLYSNQCEIHNNDNFGICLSENSYGDILKCYIYNHIVQSIRVEDSNPTISECILGDK
jgi:parallel beta-helix repeat protein